MQFHIGCACRRSCDTDIVTECENVTLQPGVSWHVPVWLSMLSLSLPPHRPSLLPFHLCLYSYFYCLPLESSSPAWPTSLWLSPMQQVICLSALQCEYSYGVLTTLSSLLWCLSHADRGASTLGHRTVGWVLHALVSPPFLLAVVPIPC